MNDAVRLEDNKITRQHWWTRDDLQYKDGHLNFAGQDMVTVVNSTETPVYFYSSARVQQNIQRKLMAMVKGDLLEWGPANIQCRGLQDGTLNLILRHRFEMELAQYQTSPDLRVSFREQIAELRQENNSLRGKLAHVTGKMAEYQLANAFRSRKRFKPVDFFEFASPSEPVETKLNFLDVQTRIIIQRADGKRMELDIVAESSEGPVLLVEVRKRQVKSNGNDVADFQEKVAVYQTLHPGRIVLAGFLSLGGFTEDARQLCEQSGIGWSEELRYF